MSDLLHVWANHVNTFREVKYKERIHSGVCSMKKLLCLCWYYYNIFDECTDCGSYRNGVVWVFKYLNPDDAKRHCQAALTK
jgi:hypothetical protein